MNNPPTIVLMTFTQDPSQSQNPPDVGLTQKASSSVPQVAQHKHCPIDVLYMPVSKPIQWNPPVRKMEALNEHEVGWLSPQCYPKWTVSLVLCGALSASPGIRLAHSSIHSIKKKWKLSTFIKIIQMPIAVRGQERVGRRPAPGTGYLECVPDSLPDRERRSSRYRTCLHSEKNPVIQHRSCRPRGQDIGAAGRLSRGRLLHGPGASEPVEVSEKMRIERGYLIASQN